jgi:hypothetical protein
MNTKDVLKEMSKGAVLCMEHTADTTQPKVFWLEPKRILIRADIAEAVTKLPGVLPGGDSLFRDAVSQTWRAGA